MHTLLSSHAHAHNGHMDKVLPWMVMTQGLVYTFSDPLVFHEKISTIKLQQHTDCKILVLSFCMCRLLFIASFQSCCIIHFQCCKVVRLFGHYNSGFVSKKFVKQAYCTV